MSAFAAFTPTHAAAVLGTLVATVPLVALGRRWHATAPKRERGLRGLIALVLLATQVVNLWWWLGGDRYDPAVSLPAHVCDLVPWVMIAALLADGRTGRWLKAIAYFWGLGLSSWAFFWPVLTKGPAHVEFWLFWAVHGQIVGVAGYLVVAAGWRPQVRDLAAAAGATILYALAVTPLNLSLPADYGFVGPGDGPAAILGPWPVRVPIVLAGEILIFALLWLPYRDSSASRSGTAATEESA